MHSLSPVGWPNANRPARRLGVGGIVGHQQHRQAAPRRLVEDEALEFAAQRKIELGEGLVEQQRLGRGDQRSHQRDASALSARQCCRVAIRKAREPRLGERRFDARAPSGPPAHFRVEAERDVGADREMGKKQVVLEQHANSAPLGRQRGHVVTIDHHPAASGKRRLEMAADIGEQRRLACTARPHDRRRAARLDAKGEIAHQRARAYRDGDDVDFERMRGHGDSIWRQFAYDESRRQQRREIDGHRKQGLQESSDRGDASVAAARKRERLGRQGRRAPPPANSVARYCATLTLTPIAKAMAMGRNRMGSFTKRNVRPGIAPSAAAARA